MTTLILIAGLIGLVVTLTWIAVELALQNADLKTELAEARVQLYRTSHALKYDRSKIE